MDVWETMKTHTDSRFVREVAQKLWGKKGLKQRRLNPQMANKGNENAEFRLPHTPEKYEILKGQVIFWKTLFDFFLLFINIVTSK